MKLVILYIEAYYGFVIIARGDFIMSMPNIPDITPEINISLEDAVNLLLASIAMEEISLSKLIDAESQKIKYVLDKQKCGGNIKDVLLINDSVNSAVINMTKLQMLLQWKLENAERLLPHKQPCPPPPPPPKHNCCGVVGKGVGCIRNEHDELSGGQAVLRAFVFSKEEKSGRSLKYTASKHNLTLYMNACPHNIHLECLDGCEPHKAIISGSGQATKVYKCGEELSGHVDYKITVWHNPPCKIGFHVILSSCNNELNHDSGFVAIKNCASNLRIEKCRDLQ